MHQRLDIDLAKRPGVRFITAMEEHAPFFAGAARKCVESNLHDALWILDDLALWSEQAFGADIFAKAAEGYALYSKDVAYLQRLYEKDGTFNHDAMSQIDRVAISGRLKRA